MLPVKYLNELKSAPTNEADFVATFIEVSLSILDGLRPHRSLSGGVDV